MINIRTLHCIASSYNIHHQTYLWSVGTPQNTCSPCLPQYAIAPLLTQNGVESWFVQYHPEYDLHYFSSLIAIRKVLHPTINESPHITLQPAAANLDPRLKTILVSFSHAYTMLSGAHGFHGFLPKANGGRHLCVRAPSHPSRPVAHGPQVEIWNR